MSVRGRLVGTGPLTQQSTLALTTDGRRSPGAWRAALRPVPPAPGLAARHRAAAGRAGTCLRRLNKSALLNPSDCTALTVCGDGEEEEDSFTKCSLCVLYLNQVAPSRVSEHPGRLRCFEQGLKGPSVAERSKVVSQSIPCSSVDVDAKPGCAERCHSFHLQHAWVGDGCGIQRSL